MIRSWIKAVQQRRQSRKELKLAEFESMFEQAMNKHIERVALLRLMRVTQQTSDSQSAAARRHQQLHEQKLMESDSSPTPDREL